MLSLASDIGLGDEFEITPHSFVATRARLASFTLFSHIITRTPVMAATAAENPSTTPNRRSVLLRMGLFRVRVY